MEKIDIENLYHKCEDGNEGRAIIVLAEKINEIVEWVNKQPDLEEELRDLKLEAKN